MKKVLWILGILFVIFTIIIVEIIASQNKGIISRIAFTKKPTVTINNRTFKLYIAKTPKDQQIGLSKYNNLPQDFGMIFIFENPDFYRFWMKDMKFPIDIIFINNGRIITIHKGVKPPKTHNERPPIYYSKEPADTVLEINAGLSDKYSIKEGDIVKLDNV